MGALRIYLALCVVACHTNGVFPWAVQDGRQAVQIFFIISGFYMAMVLSDGKYPKARDFYLSRFLRIYPPYFMVLGSTVAVFIFTGFAFHRWYALAPYVTEPTARNGTSGLLAGFLSNLTIFGQDWSTFLAHDGGGPWRISTEPDWPGQTISRYCILPQCWSVGLELTFYALVPFLNRLRTRSLLAMLLASTSSRLLAYRYLSLTFDPWTHRLFPFEISLFIAGMLGYRLYTCLEPRVPPCWKARSRWQYALGTTVALTAFHNLANVTGMLTLFTDWYVAILISYVGWAFLLPVLFFVFGDLRTDRIIGELSYPIYLVHELVIVAAAPLVSWLGLEKRQGLIVAVGSVAVAAFFYRYWIAPAERRRRQLTTGTTRPIPEVPRAVVVAPVASP